MELSIPYVLTGPDGSRAVVGNCEEARVDPDFVGYLDPENGITGLLDSAEVRESSQDVPGGDGALTGPSWLGRRPGTVQGLVLPAAGTSAVINAAIAKLKRATRALQADGTIAWTPSGGDARVLSFRRAGGQSFQISGRRPKRFQVALVSDDPYALSVEEASIVITPGSLSGEIGFTSPLRSPIASVFAAAGQQYCTNAGDAPTWPRLRVDGPIRNPILVNNSTGQQIALTFTLQVGEYLDLIPELGAILLQGTADRYSALNFTESEWWQLQPGANDVRLLAASYSAGAQLTVNWRHAWE